MPWATSFLTARNVRPSTVGSSKLCRRSRSESLIACSVLRKRFSTVPSENTITAKSSCGLVAMKRGGHRGWAGRPSMRSKARRQDAARNHVRRGTDVIAHRSKDRIAFLVDCCRFRLGRRPSNVAEGFGRAQRKSFVQFLRVAQGSLKELETQALLCGRIGFLSEEEIADLMARCERLGKRFVQFIRTLNQTENGE